jgi:arabinoxylan arabinofuranohydrolase
VMALRPWLRCGRVALPCLRIAAAPQRSRQPPAAAENMAAPMVVMAAMAASVLAANPLVPDIGMADPHMHVFANDPNVVQLYSTHDCNKGRSGPCVREPIEEGHSTVGAAAPDFRMIDWWVWSSTNLVDWKLETKVLPQSIKWDDVNASQECWATDAASFPNGTTAFYLSVGPKQIGVVTGPTPNGPFSDPLGKPLIPIGMVPTYSRDPTVLMDDDGSAYLMFGTFNYFVAKLNPDLISLAEEPKGVKILQEQHRDDKPFLHKHGGRYYLSWGCWYAIGDSPYGPFNYSGAVHI